MPNMVGNLKEAKILRWGETRNSFQGLEFYVQNQPDSGCSALKAGESSGLGKGNWTSVLSGQSLMQG